MHPVMHPFNHPSVHSRTHPFTHPIHSPTYPFINPSNQPPMIGWWMERMGGKSRWMDGLMDRLRDGGMDGGIVGWCGIFGGGSGMVALDCLRRGFVAAAGFSPATQNRAHSTEITPLRLDPSPAAVV